MRPLITVWLQVRVHRIPYRGQSPASHQLRRQEPASRLRIAKADGWIVDQWGDDFPVSENARPLIVLFLQNVPMMRARLLYW